MPEGFLKSVLESEIQLQHVNDISEAFYSQPLGHKFEILRLNLNRKIIGKPSLINISREFIFLRGRVLPPLEEIIEFADSKNPWTNISNPFIADHTYSIDSMQVGVEERRLRGEIARRISLGEKALFSIPHPFKDCIESEFVWEDLPLKLVWDYSAGRYNPIFAWNISTVKTVKTYFQREFRMFYDDFITSFSPKNEILVSKDDSISMLFNDFVNTCFFDNILVIRKASRLQRFFDVYKLK